MNKKNQYQTNQPTVIKPTDNPAKGAPRASGQKGKDLRSKK